MAMSSAYWVTWQTCVTRMSLTDRMKSSGLSMLAVGLLLRECCLFWMVLSMRNDEIILRMSLGSSMSWSFLSRPLCHTASKAFSISMRGRAASFLFSLTFFMYSLIISMCSLASLCS